MSRGKDRSDLACRLAAEAMGTAFLLATGIGSGIMGECLAGGNAAVAAGYGPAALVASS